MHDVIDRDWSGRVGLRGLMGKTTVAHEHLIKVVHYKYNSMVHLCGSAPLPI